MSVARSGNILNEFVNTARRIIREEGLGNLAKRSARRVFRRPLLRWQFIVALDFSQAFPRPTNKVPAHFEELQIKDLDQAQAIHQAQNISAETVQARLDRGERCFVIKSTEQIVSLFWTQFGDAYSERLDRHFPLSSEEIYAYDSYTLPTFRGQGLSTAVPHMAAKPFVEQGYRWLIGFVVPINQPARRAVKKRAFQVVGFTGFAELFGVRLYFHRTREVLKESPALCLRKV